MIRLTAKKLFLIDGIGALVSAFLLGIVFAQLYTFTGMPKTILYTLASIPLGFFVYDMVCYFFIRKKLSKYLKVIAYLNVIYCCLSLFFVIEHFQSLTYVGVAYFIAEMLIIITLVYIELKFARNLQLKSYRNETK